MKKEHFDRKISEIDVPKGEVFNAIDKGINRGIKEKTRSKKSGFKMFGLVSSVAASLFLASGLVFAPVSNVLASVPLIGSVYANFSLEIGSQLMKSELITKINQKASSNGVDITVTSAYYDGNVIGITFKVEGDKVSLSEIGDQGPETGYRFHLFDGKEKKQWPGTMTGLRKTADGYVAAMEFYNQLSDLPNDFTLPLTFTSITGVNGEWQFDVPVKQIPPTVIQVDDTKVSSEGEYAVEVESISKGKATTLISYSTKLPLIGKEDYLSIDVFDSAGSRLGRGSGNVLSIDEKSGTIKKELRLLLPNEIDTDTEFITIKPILEKYEKPTVAALAQSVPFSIESERFNYNIEIRNIEQEGNEFILEYVVDTENNSTIKNDVVQNFADFIMLTKSEDVHYKENGELDMNNTIGHQIRSVDVKRLKDDKRLFRSVYRVKNIDTFDIDNYSLMVPFGTLSLNSKNTEMKPIKIDLK
ncbi:DUF4179 domain-containing protein [Virgibacillus kekensis]|uniref:DUF4179 domain-containing protein n=1 Tax=Virgibacillus kekensis TaxID=202261 RepID=A0ABV9DPP7_9BACI